MEERQAIARLQGGDLSGLETLVANYQVRAVEAACLIVQDRAMAEDIVQNTFIGIAKKIHQYDSDRPFGPWFFRSVVNASIKAATHQKRHVSLNEPIHGQDFTLADLLIDPFPQPEEWLEQEGNRSCVQQALDKLPAEQRAVIVMRYFLEMSEAEMAGEMKRPKSTIKYWLRTARGQLKKMLVPISLTFLLVVIFITAVPQGRALAQAFLSLFFQTAPDVRPLDPTPSSPAVITPVASIPEVEGLTQWKVFTPAWIPEGFVLNTIDNRPEREMVVQSFNYPHVIGMQAAYFYLGQQKEPFTGDWPVGESAQVETVQIGNVTGEYVIGAWGGAEDHLVWENNPAIQHLRWQASGYYFDLQFTIMGVEAADLEDSPYYLTKDQLIAIAKSMK